MRVEAIKKYRGDPGVFGKTLVLLGGESAEREISLVSGRRVLQALNELGVDAVGLDAREDTVNEIQQLQPDRVFIALHGRGGEDGKIQAVLDYLNIPYTGSDHAASALAMDKTRAKQVWQALNLPTPDYQIMENPEAFEQVLKNLGGDVFVKPDREGSSIGMSSAKNVAELRTAYSLAKGYDGVVLVEKKIVGREYSVAILDGRALPPVWLEAKNRFYDYEAKYISSDTQYTCPSELPDDLEAALKNLSVQAFTALGCQGWGRVDIMANEASQFFLLEVNTVPGMTSHSLVPIAAKQAGLDFNALVAEILCQTL